MAAPFSAYQRPEMASSSTTLLPKASLSSLNSSRGPSPVCLFSPFVVSSELSRNIPPPLQGTLYSRQGAFIRRQPIHLRIQC